MKRFLLLLFLACCVTVGTPRADWLVVSVTSHDMQAQRVRIYCESGQYPGAVPGPVAKRTRVDVLYDGGRVARAGAAVNVLAGGTLLLLYPHWNP